MKGLCWSLLALTALGRPGLARDRVVLQPPDKASSLTVTGDIADYTAELIEIHVTVGQSVHRYPTPQVVSVETVQTESHRAGVQAFQQGDLPAAARAFEQARLDEPRPWVQREILGWQLKIALRQGNPVAAGQRFLEIVSSCDAPREYAVIPLVWGAEPTDAGLKQQGRLWLTGATDVERLLGASVLLFDQRFTATARQELERLARSLDPRVADLARTQLWRLRVAAPDLTDNEVSSWESTVRRLAVEIRAGPYFLIGRACLHRSEYDRAAAAFLWLPTAYPDNEPLTVRAVLDASRALERVGRLAEARPLLEELVTRATWPAESAEARSLLSQLENVPRGLDGETSRTVDSLE